MQKITPFLWFNDQAEEAMEFYTSIFKNSKKGALMGPPGNAQGATFEIDGLQITAFNGGPMFTFTEAISLMVDCASQEEVDYYWERLTDGGEESMCGWLKDKFGVSWQIVPTILPKLLGDRGEAGRRATQAMLKMRKLDIAALQAAFDG